MKRGGSGGQWEPFVADAQVNLGSIQSLLHMGKQPAVLVKAGLASLKAIASRNQGSPDILDDAAQDFLFAEPASLKDPQLAVSCSERAVALTHRRMPSRLLTLAQAYRAAGQIEKSRAAANEGLALLPAPREGSTKPRIRKLLEILAQSWHSEGKFYDYPANPARKFKRIVPASSSADSTRIFKKARRDRPEDAAPDVRQVGHSTRLHIRH